MTGQDTNPWLAAAKNAAPPRPDAEAPAPAPVPTATQDQGLPVLVSAHGGAGTTVWASILDAVDGGGVAAWAEDGDRRSGAVVLVLRASIDGIAAAKNAIASHGSDTFTAALAVAAGPGRTPRVINDELKILSGAISTSHAPWVPGLLLKRAAQTSPVDVPAKELAKLTTALQNSGVHVEGETK